MDSAFDIKQAKISKRIYAFLIDLLIFIVIFSASMFFFTKYVEDYNDTKKVYDDKCLEYNLVVEKTNENGEKYTTTWTVYDFMLSSFASSGCHAEKEEDIKEVTEACQKEFNEFLIKQNDAFGNDAVATTAYNTVVKYRVGFYAISSFLALLIINIVFPLIFKNGQTLGKKVFKLGLVNKKGIKVGTFNIVVRFLIGIFALEVFPLMLYLAVSNVYTIGLLFGMGLSFVNFCLFIFTKNHNLVHDYIGGTIVVDLHTTIIFNSVEEMNRIKGNANK
ncbi:MAG: RDD family protein [Bacilli bacterium]|nr:RDD family protein [Bacilli bacterium]